MNILANKYLYIEPSVEPVYITPYLPSVQSFGQRSEPSVQPPYKPSVQSYIPPCSEPLTEATYSLYMDNYFTTRNLLQLLLEHGYGGCGTSRPTEMPPLLEELRRDHPKAVEWNRAYAITIDRILFLAWQDNNLVLMQSTIHQPDKRIKRFRKRPARGAVNAANARIIRRLFGQTFKRKLPIPTIINDYNQYMNGVDLAQQFRTFYNTHRTTFRNWLPLLYWFIDAAIVNAFRIQSLYRKERGIRPSTQLEFREKLYQELFAFASHQSGVLPPQRLNQKLSHIRTRGDKRTCRWCQYKRKHLSHILAIPKRSGQTNSACSACTVPLCLKGSCWEDFHTYGSR